MTSRIPFRAVDPEIADGTYSVTVVNGVPSLAQIPGGAGTGVVQTIVPGTGIAVDDTDPANPIVSTTGGGAGGGAGWTQQVDLPLTSLSGWSPGSGAWTAQTDRITQAATTTTADRLHYNTRYPIAECVVECEIRIDSAPNANYSRAGIFIGSPPSADGGGAQWVSLNSVGGSTSSVDFEVDAVAEYPNIALAAPIPDGTWAALRVHKVGSFIDAFVDGAYVGTYELMNNVSVRSRIGLKTYACAASFRNFKVWTPAFP